MILTRRKLKTPSVGDFCQLSAKAMVSLSARESELTKILNTGRVISSKTINKKVPIEIENCDVFHIAGTHPFSNNLFILTPVVIKSDPYGYGINSVMKNNTTFIANKNIISIFTRDVKALITENIHDSKAKEVMEYINM